MSIELGDGGGSAVLFVQRVYQLMQELRMQHRVMYGLG